MKNFYFEGIQNVGDELNRFIWPALFGTGLDGDAGVALLGVGTLLNTSFCNRLDESERIVVFGSGAGYGNVPVQDERWFFSCVRGRQTCAKLGLPDSFAVADAAYLLATLDWHVDVKDKTDNVLVIPHHSSLGYVDWQEICSRCGLEFLSPTAPVDIFMKRLRGARLVLTEAMHGAILSDIARIPWVPFSFGHEFLSWKWSDWAEMFDLALSIEKPVAFYDPDIAYRDKNFGFHTEKKIKHALYVHGMGKKKWAEVIPPATANSKLALGFERFLKDLSRREGLLSGNAVFSARVSELYERLASLPDYCAPENLSPLAGSVDDFFLTPRS